MRLQFRQLFHSENGKRPWKCSRKQHFLNGNLRRAVSTTCNSLLIGHTPFLSDVRLQSDRQCGEHSGRAGYKQTLSLPDRLVLKNLVFAFFESSHSAAARRRKCECSYQCRCDPEYSIRSSGSWRHLQSHHNEVL